jgi:superoxide dismutase, Fe-Mn family
MAGEHILDPNREKERSMAFEVPPLPYDYNALEPHIDEQTMRVHHDKHHQAYVDNANKALEGTEWADRSVDDILGDAIGSTFGSFADLKAAIIDGGVKRFGSGWTWLVHDGTGLAVYSTANQDSPIMQSDVPLLGIDVWEHAYYLKYQNRRPDYLEAWWNVVNWDAVQQRFESAR